MPRSRAREHVRVVARFRPVNKKEASKAESADKYSLLIDEDSKLIGMTRSLVQRSASNNQPTTMHQDTHNFAFDKVFGTEVTQERFFNEVAKDAVGWILEGYNSTIFAYGQTGTGKTHTMFGPKHGNYDNRGVIPRAVDQLFNGIADESKGVVESTVKCSFLEIYKERLRDLLAPPPATIGPNAGQQKSLKIRQSRDRGNYVPGLTEKYASEPEEVLKFIDVGTQHRAVGRTNVNQHSSRSHAVFTITVTQVFSSGMKKTGKLHLVDLAGSENVRKTGATGMTLQEAQQINRSLSALGNVIYALTMRNRDHVPYRDSRLTFLLEDSLGGNTKTVLVVTCSPHISAYEETVSTLKFARRAKRITNKPRVNKEESVSELKAALADAREIIRERDGEIREMKVILDSLGITRDAKGRLVVPDKLKHGGGGGNNGSDASGKGSGKSQDVSTELAEARAREIHIVTQYEKQNKKYQKLKKRYKQEVEYNNQIKDIFIKQRALARNLTVKLKQQDEVLHTIKAERDHILSSAQQQGVKITPAPQRAAGLTIITPSSTSSSNSPSVNGALSDYSPPPSPRREPFRSDASFMSVSSSDTLGVRGFRERSDSNLSQDTNSDDLEPGHSRTGGDVRIPVVPPLQKAYQCLSHAGTCIKYPYGGLMAQPKKKQLFLDHNSKRLFYYDVSTQGINTTSKHMDMRDITNIWIGKQTPAFQKTAAKDVDEGRCFSLGDAQRTLDLEAEDYEHRDRLIVSLSLVAQHAGALFRVHGVLPDVNTVFPPEKVAQPKKAASSGHSSSNSTASVKGSLSAERIGAKVRGRSPLPAPERKFPGDDSDDDELIYEDITDTTDLEDLSEMDSEPSSWLTGGRGRKGRPNSMKLSWAASSPSVSSFDTPPGSLKESQLSPVTEHKPSSRVPASAAASSSNPSSSTSSPSATPTKSKPSSSSSSHKGGHHKRKEKKEFTVKAKYGYEARADNQLSFKKDDVLLVKARKKARAGWWKARLGDAVGYVPSNYLEIVGGDEAKS